MALLSLRSVSDEGVKESPHLDANPENKPFEPLLDVIYALVPKNDERWNRNKQRVQRIQGMTPKLWSPSAEDNPDFLL